MGTTPLTVIGGGIGGVATAVAVGRTGRPVRVLEQSPAFGEVGAGIQLGPNAVRVLDELGVLPAVRDTAVAPRRLVMMDATGGRELTALDLGEEFRARYGAEYLVTHRTDLHAALLEAARALPDVQLENGREVVAVHDRVDGVEVDLADPSSPSYEVSVSCEAVVGADGLRSRTRRLLSDDEPVCAGYVAYRGAIPTPGHLRDSDEVVGWVGPGLHLVQYPVRGGELYNQVAVFRSRLYHQGAAEWGTEAELEEAFGAMCPQVADSLGSIRRDARWPMYDREPIETWTRGRVTLLGDAAHPMLQYLAQGGCQALEDARYLAACLERHGEDTLKAFTDYQQVRAPRTARVQRAARAWGDFCHLAGDEALQRGARHAGRPVELSTVDWLYGHRDPA